MNVSTNLKIVPVIDGSYAKHIMNFRLKSIHEINGQFPMTRWWLRGFEDNEVRGKREQESYKAFLGNDLGNYWDKLEQPTCQYDLQ